MPPIRLIAVPVVVVATAAALGIAPTAVGAPARSFAGPGAAQSGSSMCPPVAPTSHPRARRRLRMGVDPGVAGNPVPSAEATKPVDRTRQMHALLGLRPRHRVLVVRLNRLFWSGGNHLLDRFNRQARRYARRGFRVEVQVRYHPTTAENGHIAAWSRWVRHVTDVLGANRRLVALTITNEVNFSISPNTSDGGYARAKDALIRGVEAASAVLHHHGWAHRVALGFTFAYRLDPQTDAGLFTYLKTHGGARFRRALGFVGLDDYPGTVYPPALTPGSTAGDELASAIATMRTCYLPLAGIGRSTPLWVTENGIGSNPPVRSEAAQAAALRGMVRACLRYGGSYHLTDYRWFNLRDNASNGTGLFDQTGLLRDDYSRKPAYSSYRRLIAHHGRQ